MARRINGINEGKCAIDELYNLSIFKEPWYTWSLSNWCAFPKLAKKNSSSNTHQPSRYLKNRHFGSIATEPISYYSLTVFEMRLQNVQVWEIS